MNEEKLYVVLERHTHGYTYAMGRSIEELKEVEFGTWCEMCQDYDHADWSKIYNSEADVLRRLAELDPEEWGEN